MLSHHIRIDWSELDLFEHVNNVSYFKYIQSARVVFWEHIGLMQMHTNERLGAMLLKTECEFKKPLFYPGNVYISTGVKTIGNTSFQLKHILSDDGGDIVAQAEDVIVVYDFNEHKKQAIPNVVVDKLTEHLIK